MEEPEEKYTHPFFSPKPALPKWRDIPWILFVLGVGWGFQYTPMSQLEMSDRRAGLVLIALGLLIAGGAWVVLQITHKIFPVREK